MTLAKNYRNGDTSLSDNLWIFELIALAAYEVWAVLLTVMALVAASEVWTMVEERERGVAEDGAGGSPFDALEAMKFFTLEMIIGIGAIIGGYSLGDAADRLITLFNALDDHTYVEALINSLSRDYENDTPIANDLIYHYVILFMGMAVFTSITLGGYVFGFNFLHYTDTIDCSTQAAIDDVTFGEIFGYFQKVRIDLETCYENMPALMHLLDHNQNGVIDRCEDYQLLKYLGNTEDYSMKYSRTVPTAAFATRCNQLHNPLF